MMDFQLKQQHQCQLQAWNVFYQQHSSREIKLSPQQDAYLSMYFQQISCQNTFQQKTQTQIKHEQNTQNLQKQQVQQEVSQIKPKKSRFHNFQKHLIITLKQQITKKLLKNQSQLTNSIWNIFLQCAQYNKQILCMIFQKKTNKTVTSIQKRYGFNRIQQANSQKDISAAQQILKQIILTHFRMNPIGKMLENRRVDIQQKHQLQQYIKQFLIELANDKIERRLPKNRKENILKS